MKKTFKEMWEKAESKPISKLSLIMNRLVVILILLGICEYFDLDIISTFIVMIFWTVMSINARVLYIYNKIKGK